MGMGHFHFGGTLRTAKSAAILAWGASLGHAQSCPGGPPLTGGTQRCSSNASGTLSGYTWTLWSSGTGGCMTPYGVGAAYNANWNSSGLVLARMGLQWNETMTHGQYGAIAADFEYTRTGTAGGFSYIGIYGWSNNPLVEYYIVDDWFGTGPVPTGGGTLRGTFNVDGGAYRIYTHTQVNQPSIHGTTTFEQFFSVRQTPRQCGHISISEHFKKWDSLGMVLGLMYEAKILIEAGGGTGNIDFQSATVTLNSSPILRFPGRARSRVSLFSVEKGAGIQTLYSLDGRRMIPERRNESPVIAFPALNGSR